MGFRSTFVTEDTLIAWPPWFREKYAGAIHFPNSNGGPIASVIERKTDTESGWQNLPIDIQRVLVEVAGDDWPDELVLVFLHECGGITRCEIHKDAIHWTEPSGYLKTDGVKHSYCYGCSDAEEWMSPPDEQE